MYLSTADLKALVYGAETLFGALIAILGMRLLSIMGLDLLGFGISGVILVFVGLGLMFFGLEAYLLRDDPDILG